MGRGGQWRLRGIPHVLRVRITAPFEVRVQRLAQKRGEQTRRALVDMVRQDDAGRAGRTRYLYGINIADPTLYDLVINTATLTVEAAVDMLTQVMQRPELATTEVGRIRMADQALAARVDIALATHPKTRKLRIEVEVVEGVVTLEGTADLSEAARVAHEVPGVRDVRTRQQEILPISPFSG